MFLRSLVLILVFHECILFSTSVRARTTVDDVVQLLKYCVNVKLDLCLKKRLLLEMDKLDERKVIDVFGFKFAKLNNSEENTRSYHEDESSEMLDTYSPDEENEKLTKLLYKRLNKILKRRSFLIPFLDPDSSRQMLRTFIAVKPYLLPLLIGVILKLATVLPLKLMVLSFLANTAFTSASVSALISFATVIYNFFYGTNSATSSYEINNHYDYGHDYGNGHASSQNYNYGPQHLMSMIHQKLLDHGRH